MAIGTDTLFTDNFNRADGGLGANWTEESTGAGTVTWAIATNQVDASVSGSTSGVRHFAYPGSFSSANADYKVVYTNGTTADGKQGILLRRTGSGATFNGYAVEADGANLVITRFVAGVGTSLYNTWKGSSALSSVTWTVEIEDVAGDPRITVTTTGMTAVVVTDTNAAKITAIGDVAMVFRASSTVSHFYDDFTATGTSAAAGNPVITGPAAVTEGTAVDVTGTGFDTATVDIQLVGDAASAIAQPINSQSATAINITPRNSVTEPTLAVPVAALPPTVVDLAAAGSTAQSLEVVVTNG